VRGGVYYVFMIFVSEQTSFSKSIKFINTMSFDSAKFALVVSTSVDQILEVLADGIPLSIPRCLCTTPCVYGSVHFLSRLVSFFFVPGLAHCNTYWVSPLGSFSSISAAGSPQICILNADWCSHCSAVCTYADLG